MTISTIIGALVALVEGWKAPVNVESDLADAVLALTEVNSVSSSVFGAAALKIVQKTQAGFDNLQAGQAATVATIAVDGSDYSIVAVKNGGPAATALGL